MGNKQSKVKRTSHEVLGLPPTSTKQEVKDQYKRMILKAHPDAHRTHTSEASTEAAEIIAAYTSIMKSPPILELYTEALFKTDLRKYADDFFERVSDYSGTSAPKFSDPEFERFYQIFTNFRTQKTLDTTEQEFCLKVRKIARMVRSLDKRTCESAPVVERKVPIKVKEKKSKIYPFNCGCCRKGFNSSNQLLDHLRSKKHLEKISEDVEDPREYVRKQISEIAGEEAEQEAQDTVEEEMDENKTVVEQKANDVTKKYFKQEPVVFRTCAKCKLVFSTRSQLFSHLKETHTER